MALLSFLVAMVNYQISLCVQMCLFSPRLLLFSQGAFHHLVNYYLRNTELLNLTKHFKLVYICL